MLGVVLGPLGCARIPTDDEPFTVATPWSAAERGELEAAVGRWLVTRDGFDFLLFYLSDYDYASHVEGPDAADTVMRRCDDAVGGLMEAAGRRGALLEGHAGIVPADPGQAPGRARPPR